MDMITLANTKISFLGISHITSMPARFSFTVAFGNPLIYYLLYMLAQSAVEILLNSLFCNDG